MVDSLYIVRLDDACATNDLKRWDYVEKRLDELQIKPIVGVIPQCKEPELNRGPFDSHYWDRVKRWESKGWHIALHGYSHVYKSQKKGLVPLNNYSEFAGVSFEKQQELIRNGYQLFLQNGVKPKIWMAPAHTFDNNTLKALKLETDIRVITDGIALQPFNRYGFLWIPQQCWGFSSVSNGIWTICLHIETDTLENLNTLFQRIEANRSFFLFDYDKLLARFRNRKRDWKDHLYCHKFFLRRFYEQNIRPELKKISKFGKISPYKQK